MNDNSSCCCNVGSFFSISCQSTRAGREVPAADTECVVRSTDVTPIGYDSIYINGDVAIIDGFSMFGIRVFGHTDDIQISNLTIKNTARLLSTAAGGVTAYRPRESGGGRIGPFFGVSALAVGESNDFGMGPEFFTQTGDVPQNVVGALEIINVACINNYFNALAVGSVNNIVIDDCHFDDTFIDVPLTGFVFGVQAVWFGSTLGTFVPAGSNLLMKNSTINNSKQVGDFTTANQTWYTLMVEGFTNCRFQNCQINNTTSTYVNNIFAVLLDLCDSVSFVDCTVDGMSGIGAQVVGFHMNFNNNMNMIDCTVRNCVQNGQQRDGAPTVRVNMVGIDLAGAIGYGDYGVGNSTRLQNCVVQSLISNGPAAADSRGVNGFFLGGGLNGLVARDCVATRMRALNGGDAVGFHFENEGSEVSGGGVQAFSVVNCTAASAESTTGTAKGFFYSLVDPYGSGAGKPFPISYVECKAMHNKGVPRRLGEIALNPTARTYSAGFSASSILIGAPARKHNYYNCEAEDNVYGFIFHNCTQFTIRECRSDNNVDAAGLIGEGFTDVGPALTDEPAAVGLSTSLFEFNHAFNNGLATAFVGVNQNYNVLVAPGISLPTFRAKISQPLLPGNYTYFDPVVISSPVHNISIIQ